MTVKTAHPTGLVTFLFTDVEGSTRLWASDTTGMSASLKVHDELLRNVIDAHGGYVFTTAGDAFCVAFAHASDAVRCARSAQGALADVDWPGPTLLVRMGLHQGEVEARDGDYFGPAVNTAARVASVGHGGQVILTDGVRAAAAVSVTELGVHRLRDVPEALHLHQFGDGEYPALRVVPDLLSSLPIPATSLIGREDDVHAVRSLLLKHRLVTITGLGGSGKTRLAIEVAECELAHFKHGAYFADLGNVSDDEDVVAAVSDALRLHLVGGDAIAQVLDYLADKEALVVLDNCEHVLEACAEFAEAMLAHSGEWRLVATSREHLNVDGEHVMPVPSLGVSENGSAVELFADRAIAVQPAFRVDDANRATVSELCERLDGLPLAVELAAARIVVMSPAEMLEHIDDRFRLLSGGRRRSRRQHQRTLEATLDWSYDLLDSGEQRFLNTLGVLTGPFDVGLAAAVADVGYDEALDVMASLVNKSLVVTHIDGDRTLFLLLETLRAYAQDHLRKAGRELEAARDRHLRHHLDVMAETVDAAEASTGSWVVWDWVRVQRGLALMVNLEAAIDWAIASGRNVDAGELLVAATPLWREQLSVQRILDRIDVVVAALPSASDLRERLLIPEIQLALTVDDRDRSSMAFLDGSMHVDNETAREFVLVMGANACSMTDPARSLQLADEAAVFANDAFSFWDKNRADIHLFAGEHDEALAVLRPHQGEGRWAVIDGTIAIALLMDGRPLDALQVAKGHPMSDSIRMSFGIIIGLCHLALDEHEPARRELLGEARGAALGRMNLLSNSALVGLAALAAYEGDIEWAREIILGARCQREVAINALARTVAEQIGVREEFIEQQVSAATGNSPNDCTAFLHTTLARFDVQS